ncbi:Male sterility NAD-binding [Penicillium cf. griseofulvum]|nr:Male sterility NAD-binding [Penicillium cf. griseofulvum]
MESHWKRLLATTVDDGAEINSSQRFAVIPRGPEISHGFQDISIKDLARAVNFMCWWIESMIGPAQYPETLAYMGSNDVRYFMFMLACQKTGYQAFFPSTRNSDEAHSNLLKATNCTKFFFSEERQARTREIQCFFAALDIFQIPNVEKILSDKSGLHHYPYTKSYADAENDTTCIIHSSGTTGMPKPVYLTNGFFMTIDSISHLAKPAGRQPSMFHDLDQTELVLATTPFFHLMGLVALLFSVWFEVPTLIGPDKPLSVDHMIELMRTAHPTVALCTPSMLEDLSHSDKALVCLKELKSVYFGGGSLFLETGERLRKYTQIVSVLGSSEAGVIPALVPEDAANWGYFEWNEAYGVEMHHVGESIFEMVIPRQENSRDFKGIFHTYPDINVYPTNDLYTPHPTNPRLWKFHGRKDDVIVLSNGEKFNPVGMETIIEGHPLVGNAVVVGESRFQAGLLIEPSQRELEMDERTFVEEIWPTVQVANQAVAAHGRVMKNKICFAVKMKPFKKTAKGSVQRRAVLRDYEKEIDVMYAEDLEDHLDECLPEILDHESVTEYIRQIITRVLEKPNIANAQDFYSAGLDSLMTIHISRLLQKGIQLRRPDVKAGPINAQTIYGNPTVDQLSQVVMAILDGKIQADIPRGEKIQRLVEKYTSDLPAREVCSQNELYPPLTVILTGSTGSLGTYLLHSLLSSDFITKVYCLNRSDAESRQKTGFEEKGLHLDANNWKDKVEFLQASFGEPRFGLDESKYEALLDSVDTIIHNAWKVDFNHSVDSFEDTHIQGVRRFVDFSLSSRSNAHLHFISSIGTVGAWIPEMGASIPEVPIEDIAVVLPQGYSESKHVAERICLEASQRSHVSTSVYRVGQIAGPTSARGQWNPQEWLPTIIATSKAMGKIPNRVGSTAVDWVPVDTLSNIIVEIVNTRHRSSSEERCAVFHLTNPEQASWSSLIPAIQSQYAVEPVPFSVWVAELESITSPSSADIASKPALKLLGFYRGLQGDDSTLSVALDVRRAREASVSMRTLGPVSPSLMRNWIRQWQF